MNILRLKFIRWKYVAPRLAILLVLGLVVRFTLDPVLKWAVVTGGESAVGAKVEVAELQTSLWDGELKVSGLAIANPQSPMRNLLESSDSQLLVDVNALLHGRVVVTDGQVNGLQFDTDRETSGALAEAEVSEDSGPSAFDPLLDSAAEMGEQWFDQLGDRLDTDIADQLQSPRVAKELKDRWPQQYAQMQQQVKSIQQRGKELEKSIREVKANPLRGLERLPELQKDLAALQTEVKSVQQQVGNLPKQAEADRQAVMEARKQDEALLRQKLKLGTIDGDGLTQTLLGQPVSEGLASALGWISWARDQVPSNPAKDKASRGRGTTVLFTPPQPRYLVKQIQLQGSAQLNGQPLQLVGTLTGASDAPQLLDEPTRLELRGSKALEMNVEVVMDRRGEVATDQLHLNCPQLAMAPRTMGNAKKFAVEMGEGVADFRIDLEFVGESLSGEIKFQQESLQLTPRLAKSPDGQLAKVLDQALAGVQRLEANVTLAGTIKKPQIKIKSDIGNQVAAGINSSVKQAIQARTESLLAKSRAQVDAQLQELTQLRDDAQQQLLSQLGEGQELLGQLATLTGGGGGKGLGLPAGIPQLGKSLRLDGLRK